MAKAFTSAWIMGAWILMLPWAAMASDQDAIDYRQHMMNTLDAQFNAVALILTGQAPDKNLLLHMEAMLVAATLGHTAFEPKALGGRSLPQVWEKWDDFSAKMKEFEASLAKAVAATKTEGAAGALQGLEFVSCKKCHDVYRKEP